MIFDLRPNRFTVTVAVLALLPALIHLTGCSTATHRTYEDRSPATRPYKALGRWYQPLPDASGFRQKGRASWYGRDFHGKKTANGETYNMHDMTAAHKTLPFNTYVHVHNLENGRTLVVRINDRGPFVKNRIIDLSYEAARKLDIIAPGTAWVRIEAVEGPARGDVREKSAADPPTIPRIESYAFQVGAFSDRQNAEILGDHLKRKYSHVRIAAHDNGRETVYRVRVGRFKTVEQAREQEAVLIDDGYEPFIVAE